MSHTPAHGVPSGVRRTTRARRFSLDARAHLEAATEQVEPQLRREYLSLDGAAEGAVVSIDLLNRSALFLELLLVVACATEIQEEDRTGALPSTTGEYSARLGMACKLDPEQVIKGCLAAFKLSIPRSPGPPVPFQAVVRMVRSVLEACPIDSLETEGTDLRAEPLAHRCRFAYDELRAFLVRSDPHQRAVLRVVGRAYETGAFGIPDAAAVLSLSVPDTVAVLEENGFARTGEALVLSEADRADAYMSLRRERRGPWTVTSEAIERDVIASSRIEGVDARRLS